MSSDDILSATNYPQTVPITDLSATHDFDIATDDFSDSETDLVINDHLSNINAMFWTSFSPGRIQDLKKKFDNLP